MYNLPNTGWMRVFLLSLIAFLYSGAVTAQGIPSTCPEKPVDEDSAKALAGIWFEKGEKLVEEKEYQEALGVFGCSLRMVEHPATFFNAAQAAKLAGNITVALKLARTCLELDTEGRLSDESRKLIAELKIIDAEKREKEAEEEDLLRVDDYQFYQLKDEEPLERPERALGSKLVISGIVLAGAGGAGLVLGGVFQGMTSGAVSDGEDTDRYSDFSDYKDDVDKYQKVALAGFIVGGVLAASGVTMIILGKFRYQDEDQDGNEGDSGLEISIAPTIGGVLFSGRF
jgi:tetratricopeptide (TPR) repeat protein